MTSLLEIKAAIEKLSPRDYAELMAMLHPPVDDDWDRQMKADAAAGRLDRLIEEARAAIAAGQCRPMEELLTEDGDEAARRGFRASRYGGFW
ncbi:MAG: hypothetical protein ACOYK7_07080 [Pirellulales bacterium]|jgi:hypothetical protein